MADVAEVSASAASTVSAGQAAALPAGPSEAGSASTSTTALFRKKSHKQAALRKPLSSAAVKDEQDADDKTDIESAPAHTSHTTVTAACGVRLTSMSVLLSVLSHRKALEETRLLQKFRAKQHSAAVNSNIEALLSSAADDQSHSTAGSRLTTIGATFQAEEETTDVVEEKMRQYIEEQLDKRRQDSNTAKRPRDDTPQQSADSESAAQHSSEAAVLNDVAPLLRRKAVLDEKEEESAERWLRGIAEVQLPMEHRMHNVERTEAARARIAQKPSTHSPSQLPPAALPVNYNSNFAAHKVRRVSHSKAHSVCEHSTRRSLSPLLSCVCSLCRRSGTATCGSSGSNTRRRWRSTGRSRGRKVSRWRSRRSKDGAGGEGEAAVDRTPPRTAAWSTGSSNDSRPMANRADVVCFHQTRALLWCEWPRSATAGGDGTDRLQLHVRR